jgi:carboxyl-terminal processing protease
MKTKVAILSVLMVLAADGAGGMQAKDYLNTFETVWQKVNETFFDPSFGGLDWKAAHERYRPLIAAAKTDEEFYGLANRMLWELKVSHANLVPPGTLARYEPLVFAGGSAGIDLRLIRGAAMVTSVKPGSAAQKAGLRPGSIIQAIDGIPVEQIVKEADAKPSPPLNERNRVSKATKAILGRIFGSAGTEVALLCADEGGTTTRKTLVREKRAGVPAGPNGMFFFALDFETKRLDEGIGYIRANTLQPQLAPLISQALKSMGELRGVIFDLRGNSGGEIEQMPELFLKEKALLYLNRSKGGETKIYFDPAADAFLGPLVLLVDALSGSASEVLAAGLQAIGRAAVIGERTPGGAMEMDSLFFPNGAVLMYPVAQMVAPNGTVLEGRGVVPDIEVGLDRESLLKGIDPQLRAAVGHIEKASRK